MLPFLSFSYFWSLFQAFSPVLPYQLPIFCIYYNNLIFVSNIIYQRNKEIVNILKRTINISILMFSTMRSKQNEQISDKNLINQIVEIYFNMAKYKIQREYIFSNKDYNQVCSFLGQYKMANLNQIRDHKGNTALHQAVYCSDDTRLLKKYLNYMEKYLSKTQNEDPQGKLNQFVNRYNQDGLTAMHFAAYKGHHKSLQVLCDSGGDYNKLTQSGQNVLHMAAQGGMVQTFIFFQSLVDINSPDSKRSTPLHWASYMNSQSIVTYLLSKPNIEIDAQDQNQQTPLQLATAYGHTSIVKKLLMAGAKRNIVNKKGETAIKIARDNQFKNIQKILNQQYTCFDYIKICLNLKTVYKPANRSFFKPFIFIFILLVTAFLRVFLFEEKPQIDFIKFIQIGFFAIILLSYTSLILNPKKREPKKLMDFLNGDINIKKVCLVCAAIKPPRSLHCQRCKMCFQRYDHHCYWINNCINKKNLKRFITFIILFQLFLLYFLGFSTLVLINYFKGEQHIIYIKKYQEYLYLQKVTLIYLIGMGSFSFLFFFPMLSLIIVQLKNIFLNKTTYERYTKDKISTLTESTSHLLSQQMKSQRHKQCSFTNVRAMCTDDDLSSLQILNSSIASEQ